MDDSARGGEGDEREQGDRAGGGGRGRDGDSIGLGFGIGGPRGWAGLELGGPAGLSSLSLTLILSLTEKKIERRKEREGLGKDVGHADNFSGLTKMCLFRENRKGHD